MDVGFYVGRFKYYLVLLSISMQTISIKIDEELMKAMKKLMKEHRYSTQTEFIREAIRMKLSEERERKDVLKRLHKIYGASRIQTTDEDLHRVREEISRELEDEIKEDSLS